MQATDDRTVRRPVRQDTYDLRDQIATDEHSHHSHDMGYPSDEEHSVLEDDSDGEDRDEYMDDDDGSSSLSIPNESIDFDLVYALHSFAATVEGQANVVKGDSLFLMDDSNSYWWLVRVLKTQEVGYIPAENIETPFERLARLNKHRNVDLASATQAELEETRDRLLSSRTGSNQATPSPTPGPRGGSRARSRQVRSVIFNVDRHIHRYPPAVWGDEEDEEEDIEWDDDDYEDVDPDLAEEQEMEREKPGDSGTDMPSGMEPDDGMSWEEGAVESMQAQAQQARAQAHVVVTSPPAMEDQQEVMHRQQQQQLQMAQQRLQEEHQRNLTAAQTGQLGTQTSRERTGATQDGVAPVSPTSPKVVMDPAQVTETRKVSITPPVARSADDHQSSGPILPSTFMQQQSEERKRTREEIEALENEQRKKANKGNGRPSSAVSEQQKSPPSKLRKERSEVPTDDEGGKDKKKKGGVLAGLFGRKKDKSKDKASGLGSDTGSLASAGSLDNISGRNSGESGHSSNQLHGSAVMAPDNPSPTTSSARQQQQVAIQQAKNSSDPRRPPGAPQTPPSAMHPQISQHASQLRQRDQQQQALYQQYLNRSPSSPPEAQPSYGLQSASAVMGSTSFNSSQSSNNNLSPGPRPRPGSLILSPGAMDGQGMGLPDLSVIRVFAGENLQTEATFKTVLLNSSTSASDLVRQAIQRFRLPIGDSENDYYLTIKQVEGSSATILPNEKPLGVFESLVEAAMELPKVKRSSVGSISSIASNLSMHPAIKKLPMNDFTDDSAVKFYLNRRRGDSEDSITGDEGDETLMAESMNDEDIVSPRSNHFLTINTSSTTVTPERFSSPSFRFALQLVIHPEDLPDDMVFDPLTEAIVFKNTLRDRPTNAATSPGISATQRKKVFVFPKNATVAEVIERGLERFGIAEGVVDGGDEVEDKLAKRRSSMRVRYCLAVDVNGKDKELAPTSKVIDAFSRPPSNRITDRRSNDNKRRSVDSTLLLGSSDDIAPDDPVFILRRAVAYRPSSKHRLSAPLDEIALQKLHRESMSGSSIASDSTAGPEEPKKPSKQEIIAAQRAATRANQRAILSAQTNSSRGLDVLLPGNAMIRSSRHEIDDRMRYSYVEPDGETYDISEIVEAEWRGEAGPNRERSDAVQSDLLHGVLSRGKDGLGAKLDRVLSQIKHDKNQSRSATSQSAIEEIARTTSPSVYTSAETNQSTSRVTTPNAQAMNARSPTPTGTSGAAAQRATSPLSRLSSYRTASEGESDGRRTATPSSSSHHKDNRPPHDRQQSLASVISESSQYGSSSPSTPRAFLAPSKPVPHKRVILPKDDFGLSQMMAIIETKNMPARKQGLPPMDPVDELLFGRRIDLDTLHPQIRDIYSSTFKQLEEMDNSLDELLQHVAHAF